MNDSLFSNLVDQNLDDQESCFYSILTILRKIVDQKITDIGSMKNQHSNYNFFDSLKSVKSIKSYLMQVGLIQKVMNKLM
jgi:hypothetical protein